MKLLIKMKKAKKKIYKIEENIYKYIFKYNYNLKKIKDFNFY